MKLIGSYASPFVRRIRILLKDTQFNFQAIDVFSPEGRKICETYGPVAKIPILENNKVIIWDSLQIAHYLNDNKIVNVDLSAEEIKKIITLNELTDSGILLFQLKKFALDPEWSNDFSQNQLRRLKNVLAWFNQQESLQWSLSDQWLFCTLDWFLFRNIIEWQQSYPKLHVFHEKNKNRTEVLNTAPGVVL